MLGRGQFLELKKYQCRGLDQHIAAGKKDGKHHNGCPTGTCVYFFWGGWGLPYYVLTCRLAAMISSKTNKLSTWREMFSSEIRPTRIYQSTPSTNQEINRLWQMSSPGILVRDFRRLQTCFMSSRWWLDWNPGLGPG